MNEWTFFSPLCVWRFHTRVPSSPPPPTPPSFFPFPEACGLLRGTDGRNNARPLFSQVHFHQRASPATTVECFTPRIFRLTNPVYLIYSANGGHLSTAGPFFWMGIESSTMSVCPQVKFWPDNNGNIPLKFTKKNNYFRILYYFFVKSILFFCGLEYLNIFIFSTDFSFSLDFLSTFFPYYVGLIIFYVIFSTTICVPVFFNNLRNPD